MTEQEARAGICAGLTEVYGMQEGIRMAGTVVTGIMNDFNGMLHQKENGESVQEEYRLEDGRAVVIISGRVLKNGTACYDVVRIVQ